MLSEIDTIAAIATSLGEASVGIVRVSGPKSWDIGQQMFRKPTGKPVENKQRAMWYGTLVRPETGDAIDECVTLWMPAPNSYTAEDVLEFQVHGGIHVVQSVLHAVLDAGARLAEPGEFTKRAFLNGRIDLSQAEAVIDLIRSKTDLATRSALGQVKGRFSDEIRELRKILIRLQAHVEVTIDYPEHDVEAVAAAAVMETGGELLSVVERMLSHAKFGQILREGIRTAIIGRPNVGKSSLMNALLQRDRAIVTEIPGTTRDVLEEYVNVLGVPFRLMDTAGIRETEDIVEQIGVERSRHAIAESEFVIVVLNGNEELGPEDETLLAETDNMPRVVVVNKMDLPQKFHVKQLEEMGVASRVVHTSLQTHEGLSDLHEAMLEATGSGAVRAEDVSYMTNARQVTLLRGVRDDLVMAIEAAASGATLDIVAVQLQSAYSGLGFVIGEEAGEDLLDEIFSNFCLGK